MDILKAEIEARKKTLGGKKKKWMRRGEIEAANTTDSGDGEQQSKRHKGAETDESPQKAKISPHKKRRVSDKITEDDKVVLASFAGIDERVLFRRLRKVNEPIKYFGESPEARLLRLHEAEISRPELMDSGTSDEFNHLMRKQNAAEGTSQIEAEVPMPERSDSYVKTVKEVKQTKSDDQKKERERRIHMMAVHENNDWSREQSVRYFFKHLIKEWEIALEKRHADLPNDNRKMAAKLKRDQTMHAQTQKYMQPLFKMLKKRTLDPYIEKSAGLIMDACKQREYQQAHDHYIKIAIGNAREKISEGAVAHVLNDERARKYLQGMKRLLTFCQIRYPGDPSKTFEYKATQFEEE